MTIDKAKISFLMVFALFWMSKIGPVFGQDDLERSYNIQANFNNISKRTFPIQMTASVTNRSKEPINELQWVVYPNRFLHELPYLNDMNYRRIYPNGYSKGYLKILSMKVDGQEVVEKLQNILAPPLPDKTLVSIQLDQPLIPGETKKFDLILELKVPEKFGSFGYYRNRLTLSGGWTPYIVARRNGMFYPTDQSPKAQWNVQIQSNLNKSVGSSLVLPDQGEITAFKRENIGQFPIQIGSKIKQDSFTHDDFNLHVVYDERKPEKILEPLQKIFGPWSTYVEEMDLDKSMIRTDLSFVQAPLREMLAVDAGDVSFFSDRAYKVIQGLHSFHNVPLIRMLFSQALSDQVVSKENSENYYWITEVIASQLTEDFLQTQHYKYRDARNIGAVKLFSIFPLVDLIIHTPQFAFFDVFYDFVYPYDPVRDEFDRFQNHRQYGRSILAHMIDELGEENVRKIITSYIQNPQKTFLQTMEDQTGKNLEARIVHWREQRPIVNYKIGKIKTKKVDGAFQNQITVKKEAVKPLEEPVTIEIVEKSGEKQSVTWDSKEPIQTYDIKTKTKLKIVEIDPKRRLLETDLSDNRSPPYWKFVLTEFFAEYDFNAHQPVATIQSEFRRKYGGKDRYNLGGYYQADSYGVSVGYARLFGQLLDSLRLSNQLGIQYNFAKLGEDTVIANSLPPQEVVVTDSGYLTSLTASYVFGNQISYTNPLSGGYGGVGFTYGSKAFGGDFDYYSTSTNLSWIVKLHPSHLLAFRGFFAVAGNDSMPSQVQLRLGGIYAMRGLSLDDEQYIGRNMILFSGEYRHFLLQDLDVNLGLFRVRDIQGALFGDAGQVTNTLQEKADQLVIGSSVPTTTFSDLFKIQNFETDVGYGLRFFVDYLGVYTSLLRFDIAKSLSDQSQGYRFYFGVTQSF